MASSLLISPNNLLCSTTFPRKHTLYRYNTNTASEKTYLMKTRCTRSLVSTPGGKTITEMAKGVVPCKGDGVAAPGIGIVPFISGKNLFVTGATGFLAKVLIEKILRTVPQVGKIYLLIKAKNTGAAMDRLKHQIMEADLFKCLKKIHGRGYESFMLSKLIPVAGNVCEPGLGMDDETADIMAGAVNIVVNSAATTTFDERYDVSVEINTKGPCRLMQFAKKCDNLQLFLQVSTAYINGQRQGTIFERPFGKRGGGVREGFVSETPYPLSKLHVEAEIQSALSSGKEVNGDIHSQKMKELGLERARKYGWQDTYVFTKAMGEMMIDNMRGDIPVVIIRPSVIESTYKEPFPGWIEGNRMMDPVILCYGKGQLTGFLVDPNGILDVVPADMVVNATLAAIAKHGQSQKPEINVYQVASSTLNPLVFHHLADLIHQHFTSTPYIDSKGVPISVPCMKLFNSMEEFSSHIWRDAIGRSEASLVASPNGKSSKKLEIICRKAVEQAKYLASIYQPYSFYGGRFDSSNTESLMEIMSNEERREFGFDVRSIDWRDYISNVHIPGLRKHVMKGRGVCNTA